MIIVQPHYIRYGPCVPYYSALVIACRDLYLRVLFLLSFLEGSSLQSKECIVSVCCKIQWFRHQPLDLIPIFVAWLKLVNGRFSGRTCFLYDAFYFSLFFLWFSSCLLIYLVIGLEFENYFFKLRLLPLPLMLFYWSPLISRLHDRLILIGLFQHLA